MASHGGARPNAGRKPGAVKKAKLDIAEKAKAYGEDALATLADIMGDTNAPHSARVSAANHLLDRGFGKPMQAVEVGGKDGEKIAFTGFLIDRASKPDPSVAD